MSPATSRAEPLDGAEAGIVRVVHGRTREHVGMAIAVSDRLAITCAHVVNAAQERPLEEASRPDRLVQLAFPLVVGDVGRLARVVAWQPILRSGPMSLDVALLELEDGEPDFPVRLGRAVLADVTGRRLDNDSLTIFGLAAGELAGAYTNARFGGSTQGSLVQISSAVGEPPIRPGYSGGAVFSRQEGAVVGMVVRRHVPQPVAPDEHESMSSVAAYMTPVDELARLLPGLPVERRQRPAWAARAWLVVSGLLVLSSLVHWWAARLGGGPLASLSLARGHPELSAFWGMHVYALLAPCLIVLSRVMARDYPLHPWYARILPADLRGPLKLHRARPGAAIALVLVALAFPAAAQVHFLSKFAKDGSVYAHVNTLAGAGDEAGWGSGCIRRCYCRHREATRWTAVGGWSGLSHGYLDDVYRYGQVRHPAEPLEDCQPGGHSSVSEGTEDRPRFEQAAVTYFPLLQPLLVLLGTGLAWWWIAAWLIGCLPRSRPIREAPVGAIQ